MFKEAPEMSPLKWALVGAAAVGGMCAIGYLAGEQKEEAPKGGGGQNEELQKMMAQMMMGGMGGGMPGMGGGGGIGGGGGMPGMGGRGGMGRGMPEEDSDESEEALVESESDEDSFTSIATKRPTPVKSTAITPPSYQYYETFSKFMKAEKFVEASIVGEKYLQSIGDKRSSQYAVSCLEVANAYKRVNKAKAKELFLRSFEILTSKTPESPEIYKYTISCCLELQNILPEAEHIVCQEKLYDVLEEWRNREPDNEEAKSLFQLWMVHVMNIWRQLGQWSKVEALYKKFADMKTADTDPVQVQDMVENYASALHQQGRTVEAIQVIQGFMDEIKHKKQSKYEAVVEWGYERMSKFYFYLDDFEGSERCLISLKEYILAAHPTKDEKTVFSIPALVQLMTVEVELNKEEDYEKLYEQLKSMEPEGRDNSLAHTRSKYLITQSTVMTNHYHLVFKVCIKRPHRAEGEPEKTEDELIRKLDKFYIEATFENPSGEEPLVCCKDVNHYDVEVDSPTFTSSATPYKWYWTKIYLYEDSTKQNLLGKHYQNIYLKPDALQRKKRYF
jgi:tetratricopeptide (TPR) repeat protein